MITAPKSLSGKYLMCVYEHNSSAEIAILKLCDSVTKIYVLNLTKEAEISSISFER